MTESAFLPRAARLACAAAALLSQFLAAPAPADELDRIIAVVDEDVVMESELQEQVARVRDGLRQQGIEVPPTSVLERQVLEQLVLEKVQLQFAQQAKLKVEEKELDRAVDNIARRNKLEPEQFRKIIESEGIPFSRFREKISQQMLIAKLRQSEVENRVKVSDQEVKNFLRNEASATDSEIEYHLGHILVSIPTGADDAQIKASRAKAEDALRRVQNGEDFGDIAIRVSDGQQALERGDLGWRKASAIPSLFADAVSTMQVGETSGLIVGPTGFHIVRLVEKRSGEKIMVEQSHARHILIKPNTLVTPQQAVERLRNLKARIEAGADFAELARTNSDDRKSALEGGELGWVAKGEMVPEFEEAMLSANVGDIVGPFGTEYGFHILQVTQRRQYDGTEEIKRDRARRAIREQKVEEKRQGWLRDLRNEAYVEFRNN